MQRSDRTGLEAARLVVVYERVSSDRQDISRQAVQRERAAADYPEREIVVIQDDGVSASKITVFDRRGGRELCDLIAAGRVEAIYTDEQSRLSRGKQSEWWNFADLCEQSGARIVIDGRELRLDDEGDEMRSALDAMIARRESLLKSHRVKGGLRKRAASGLHHGGYVPLGYRPVTRGGERVLAVKDDEAATVRRIFDEYLGGAGCGAIAHRLNQEGIRPPRAARWERTSVAFIVRNPVYAGKVRAGDELVDGRHEAIIDLAVWSRAQRVRAHRSDAAGGGRGRLPADDHLLTRGLLRCGSCGGAMSARTYRHRPGLSVYLCSTRRTTGGSEICQQPQVARGPIDSAVLAYFASVGVDEEETLARLRESDERRVAEARAFREEAEAELLRCQEKIGRADADYGAGRLSAARYERLSDRWEREREAAGANLALLREREQAAIADARARDFDAGALAALAKVRAMVAGHVSSADDVEALRAALTELFSAFVLRRVDDAPAHIAVWPELALGEYFIEPVVRPDAVLYGPWVMPPSSAEFGTIGEPVPLDEALRSGVSGRIEYGLRRVPLDLSGGQADRAARRSDDLAHASDGLLAGLFAPFAIGEAARP